MSLITIGISGTSVETVSLGGGTIGGSGLLR